MCVCVSGGGHNIPTNTGARAASSALVGGRRACVFVCVCVQARGRPPTRACRVPPLRAVRVRVCVCVCVCVEWGEGCACLPSRQAPYGALGRAGAWVC